MKLSVVTPAHNEERHLASCVFSVFEFAKHAAIDFEHIVVLNRCNDRTEEIAASLGCRIVREDARNLSKIRNAGVSAATGEIIVTIDADARCRTIASPGLSGSRPRDHPGTGPGIQGRAWRC